VTRRGLFAAILQEKHRLSCCQRRQCLVITLARVQMT